MAWQAWPRSAVAQRSAHPRGEADDRLRARHGEHAARQPAREAGAASAPRRARAAGARRGRRAPGGCAAAGRAGLASGLRPSRRCSGVRRREQRVGKKALESGHG